MKDTIELTIESKYEFVELVGSVTKNVTEMVGFDDEASNWIELAIRESVINAIKHGNRLDADKPVDIKFTLGGSTLTVYVRDRGPGFDPLLIPDPLDPDREVTRSIWPAVYPRLLEQILAHRSTIVFANSRRLAERICSEINNLAGEEIAKAHHGSVAREQRLLTEEALKRGELRAVVATSSLELGIDMGTVDLVLQVESPTSVASGTTAWSTLSSTSELLRWFESRMWSPDWSAPPARPQTRMGMSRMSCDQPSEQSLDT